MNCQRTLWLFFVMVLGFAANSEARYFDPMEGRFISKDPIGFAGGVNQYAYVQNNPVNWIDPWGLLPGESYPSPRDAGRQAIIEINPTSIKQGVEYGGVIYTKSDGSSSYTAPVQGGQAGVWIPFYTSPPASGWYHTHGANDPGYDNENYSPEDLRISDGRNVPGYLGTPSRTIKEYVPIPGMPGKGKVSLCK